MNKEQGQKRERVITTELRNGALWVAVAGVGHLVLHPDDISAEVRERAMWHGLAARVVDAGALGKGATAEEKFEAMKRIVEHYKTGTPEWGVRVAGEGGGGDVGLVVAALARVYGDTHEQAEATIARTMVKKGLDRKGALALWAGTDKVAAEIAAIKAERAAKKAAGAKVDADDLRTEMGAAQGAAQGEADAALLVKLAKGCEKEFARIVSAGSEEGEDAFPFPAGK